jgi:hypothetical protein
MFIRWGCYVYFSYVFVCTYRFVPPKITQMYGLKLPDYGIGSSQIVRIIT